MQSQVVAFPDKGQTSSDQSSSEQEQSQPPLSVLYVEDDASFSSLIERLLARDTTYSYEFDVARNSGAAQLICSSKNYDCILLDYHLPDAEGKEIVEDLKKVLGDQIPPLIFLSASNDQQVALDALHVGAFDLLPKSIVSTASLSRAIQNGVEKRRLKSDLHQKNLKLERTNTDLLRRENEIENFYQSVSHELKTPLTAAREFIALVRDEVVGPVTEEQTNLLELALECCDQIRFQMDELLEVTRLGTGKIQCKKQPVAVDDIILRSMASVAAAARDKNIELNVDEVEDRPTEICVDANRIVQVLSNLLKNAVQYTEPEGSVSLETRLDPEGNYVQIAVSDTGTGIDKKHLPYIFDRLYQVPTQPGTERSGLGLGLNIAKEIVELHDGDIWVESKKGKGTKFTIHLPTLELEEGTCDKEQT